MATTDTTHLTTDMNNDTMITTEITKKDRHVSVKTILCIAFAVVVIPLSCVFVLYVISKFCNICPHTVDSLKVKYVKIHD